MTSIPMADIIKNSEGMLRKKLYVVRTSPAGDDLSPLFEQIEDHIAYQLEIEKNGTLFAAGPVWTEETCAWNGEGMIVIRADSLSAAKDIANADPMHSSGARVYSIEPWLINEGNLSVQVSFSNSSMQIK